MVELKGCDNMSFFNSSFDNNIWGFKRVAEVNPVKVHCKHCGWVLNFIYHKKQICPRCQNYVYPTKRDEFKEKLRKKLKEN